MLVTLVAILCNSQLCLEKVVTNSEQSGITMTACQVNAQIGIAEWLANGPYHEWRLKAKHDVRANPLMRVWLSVTRRSDRIRRLDAAAVRGDEESSSDNASSNLRRPLRISPLPCVAVWRYAGLASAPLLREEHTAGRRRWRQL